MEHPLAIMQSRMKRNLKTIYAFVRAHKHATKTNILLALSMLCSMSGLDRWLLLPRALTIISEGKLACIFSDRQFL